MMKNIFSFILGVACLFTLGANGSGRRARTRSMIGDIERLVPVHCNDGILYVSRQVLEKFHIINSMFSGDEAKSDDIPVLLTKNNVSMLFNFIAAEDKSEYLKKIDINLIIVLADLADYLCLDDVESRDAISKRFYELLMRLPAKGIEKIIDNLRDDSCSLLDLNGTVYIGNLSNMLDDEVSYSKYSGICGAKDI